MASFKQTLLKEVEISFKSLSLFYCEKKMKTRQRTSWNVIFIWETFM